MAKIEIRTGSDSDIRKIKDVYTTLKTVGVSHTPRVLSAHRNTQQMITQAQTLEKNGFSVCIAAAGGSAHLPGMTASETVVPVIGIPVMTKECAGKDSFYSIVQMPEGIPTGCVGVTKAKQAALIAASIVSLQQTNQRNQIRKIRNLVPIHAVKSKSPRIVLITFGNTKTEPKKKQTMLELISELGIDCEHFTVKKKSELVNIIDRSQTRGVQAIISLVNSVDTSLSKTMSAVASQTDIPSIILPVAKVTSGEHVFRATNHTTEPFVITGINRYQNAVLFAAQIAGLYHGPVRKKLVQYRKQLTKSSQEKDRLLKKHGVTRLLK